MASGGGAEPGCPQIVDQLLGAFGLKRERRFGLGARFAHRLKGQWRGAQAVAAGVVVEHEDRDGEVVVAALERAEAESDLTG